MIILVSNDDGIQAVGLKQLVKSLSRIAEVYVFAPDGERSAISHAITLGKKISLRPWDVAYAKEAYAISGTPADCVKLGLQKLKDKGLDVDFVIAGINLGSNLGKDTVYSGTVGAAMEGAMTDVLSVAISVDSMDKFPEYLSTSGDVAVEAVKLLYKNKKIIPKDMFFNINVPNIPKNDFKEMRWTILGDKKYADSFKLVEKSESSTLIEYYELTGEPKNFSVGNIIYDVIAVLNGYASITPLNFDFTCHNSYEKLQNVNLKEINQ